MKKYNEIQLRKKQIDLKIKGQMKTASRKRVNIRNGPEKKAQKTNNIFGPPGVAIFTVEVTESANDLTLHCPLGIDYF